MAQPGFQYQGFVIVQQLCLQCGTCDERLCAVLLCAVHFALCFAACFELIVPLREHVFLQVMGEMVKKHVHRVYIVDDPALELPMPLSVVTTSDVMQLIAKYYE